MSFAIACLGGTNRNCDEAFFDLCKFHGMPLVRSEKGQWSREVDEHSVLKNPRYSALDGSFRLRLYESWPPP